MTQNRFLKFFAYIICYCIYPFSFLVPRNRRKIAFGSFRGAFNDNAKFLFIHAQEQNKEFRSAWLSTNKKTVQQIRAYGLTAYNVLSWRGIWFALTAKFWFYNSYRSDIMFCFSGGAFCFNLWHGVPIKSIEFDIKTGPLAERFFKRTFKERFYHPEAFVRPDLMLAPSQFYVEYFSKAFRINPSQCVKIGCPRNEILLFDEEKRQNFIKNFEPQETRDFVKKMQNFGKVFIYMPTWRDSQKNIFSEALDLKRLNEILKKLNNLLIIKPHANTKIDENLIFGLSNVMLFDAKMDAYALLPYTDTLITDYSSIMYDYMLMKKRIILYMYDYEEFVKEREFIFPFDENVEGEKIYDFEQLCNCIEKDEYKIDENKRTQIIEKLWSNSMAVGLCDEILKRI